LKNGDEESELDFKTVRGYKHVDLQPEYEDIFSESSLELLKFHS
jgi:hypothetical protein